MCLEENQTLQKRSDVWWYDCATI